MKHHKSNSGYSEISGNILENEGLKASITSGTWSNQSTRFRQMDVSQSRLVVMRLLTRGAVSKEFYYQMVFSVSKTGRRLFPKTKSGCSLRSKPRFDIQRADAAVLITELELQLSRKSRARGAAPLALHAAYAAPCLLNRYSAQHLLA